MIIDAVKIFIPTIITFIFGLSITPFVSNYLYKHEMWKKKSVSVTLDGKPATISSSIHKDETKKTPRMGGIIVWVSVLFVSFLFMFLGDLFSGTIFSKLTFLSRNQTWLPIFTLFVGSITGFVDDYLVVNGRGGYIGGGGIPLRIRFGIVIFLALCGSWWFISKLGVSSIMIPFYGSYDIGIFFIPLFVIVMLAIFSGGVIDGIDGLSGGIFASIFSAYGAIAFAQHQYDLSALCGSIVGGILAFLWFNIPPARFYMSETGILGLTTALTVVAFLTKAVVVLPIIAFPLFVSSGSVIIQMVSKKLRNGKKVFLVAPIHHHFEALGWPSYKVTMRFWIISVMCSILGVVIFLIG